MELINRYCHGYVAIPVILTLEADGVFSYLKEHDGQTLQELTDHFNANEGHLNVALNLLLSLGWLERDYDSKYVLTDKASDRYYIPKMLLSVYQMSINEFLLSSHCQFFIAQAQFHWGLRKEKKHALFLDMLDGVILAPLFLALSEQGAFDLQNHLFLIQKLPKENFASLANFFQNRGWIQANGDQFIFTLNGAYLFERIYNLATVVSYRPLLSRINALLFGHVNDVFGVNDQGFEKHIDRQMNVLGSGSQHELFFTAFKKNVLQLFNNQNFVDQPMYIADMGCGNGALLKILYQAIATETSRGKMLEAHPLIMIGADFNEISLFETEKTLTLHNIPFLTIKADIGDPEQFIFDLQQKGIDPDKILHIRSFLDHDRTYLAPDETKLIVQKKIEQRKTYQYEGVFVDNQGKRIASEIMMQSLVEHMGRWGNVNLGHGLMTLEVHYLSPQVVRQYIDESENLHFDAYHGFSKQYLVTIEDYIMACAENGLFINVGCFNDLFREFLFYRVSVNHFEKKEYCIRYACLEDLEQLVVLENQCWSAKLQSTVETIKQRLIIYPRGQFVLEINNIIIGVIYTQCLNHVDEVYGKNELTISLLHDSAGSILQLLGLYVHPDYQGFGYGQTLRDFALLIARITPNFTQVIGVTRCQNYKEYQKQYSDIVDYIQTVNEAGLPLDPTLSFHVERGAIIKNIINNYRPNDTKNKGVGVLICYDLDTIFSSYFLTLSQENSAIVPPKKISYGLDNTELSNLVYPIIQRQMLQDSLQTFNPNIPFMSLGIDSLGLTQLRLLISRALSIELEIDIFFRYSTPIDLLKYLTTLLSSFIDLKNRKTSALMSQSIQKMQENQIIEEAIAIIGLALRFPKANSPQEYWTLLQQDQDVISRVPANRWSQEIAAVPYGGFIENIDCFDADFFDISAAEAKQMDPQQRLLLEVTWHALESANINPKNLKAKRVGIFIGQFSHDYELLQAQSKDPSVYYATGASSSVSAGRLSYFLGSQGPTITLDTACSSSLVAVHLARKSLQHRECDIAIVGGVNALLAPQLQINFTQVGMLAADGHCKTFDDKADGYVRSEGCGVVVLQRLNEAQEKQQPILAVIKGSAINHDGASNGLTAPNGLSQEELLKQALNDAGLNANDIDYIEAHGTGTRLGDPIELNAIKSVFSNKSRKKPLIIGTAKTYVGHLEAAAGMAGLIKTILSLQYQRIPKLLHFSKLNPQIELGEHVCLAVEEQDWKITEHHARRAGISSFGFSGTNAHVILEEAPVQQLTTIHKPYFVITLSGKTADALKQRQTDLLDWLNNENNKDIPLNLISYTLNQGRGHFTHRAACVIDNKEALKTELEKSIANKESENYFSEVIDKNNKPKDDAIYEEVLTGIIHKLQQQDIQQTKEYRKNLRALANLYVKGYSIDWKLLHQDEPKQWISLPTYPFLKEQYWLPESMSTKLNTQSLTAHLHPLLHRNTSTIALQRFESIFDDKEFFFRDHIIAGNKILPGVAYLEMARAAGVFSLQDKKMILIENIVWLQPIIIDSESKKITIALYPKDEVVMFEIRSISDTENNEMIVHSQGQFLLNTNHVSQLNHSLEAIESIASRCAKTILHDDIYHTFSQAQFNHGKSFQTLEWLKIGKDDVIGKLQLSETISNANDRDQYYLHPALLDGALQSIMGFALWTHSQARHLPFALDRIELFETMPNHCYVHAKRGELRGEIQRYDLDVLSEAGKLCVRMIGFSTRALKLQSKEVPALHFYRPEWHISSFVEPNIARISALLIFSQDQTSIESLKHELQKQQENLLLIQVEFREAYQVKSPVHYQIILGNKSDYDALFRDLEQTYPNMQWNHIVNLCSDETHANITQNTLHLLSLTQVLLARKISSVNLLHLYLHKKHQLNTHEMYAGFALSLRQEHPHYRYKIIGLDEKSHQAENLSTLILNEFSQEADSQVRYIGDQRIVKQIVPVSLKETDTDVSSKIKLHQQGVYLITGGLGGLGLIFARYLLENYQAKLILTGRSALTKDRQVILDELKILGGEAIYLSGDISSYQSTKKIIKQGEARFGKLNGIIHAAGVLQDNFILKKTLEDVQAVFAPKIDGLLHLDKLTQNNKLLDYLIVFSSVSSILGNVGQSDYASANAFMDAFIDYRNHLQKTKRRSGKSISINWPLWQDGGMQIDEALQQLLLKPSGLELLSTEKGIEAFHQILYSGHSQIIPLFERQQNSKAYFFQSHSKQSTELVTSGAMHVDDEKLYQLVLAQIITDIASTLHLSSDLFDPNKNLTSYGFDSMTLTVLTTQLNATYNLRLMPTIFFEYTTLKLLVDYLIKFHAETLLKKHQLILSHVAPMSESNKLNFTYEAFPLHSRFISTRSFSDIRPIAMREDIAVIGMSGVFPKSNNLEEFWKNLREGKDCIRCFPEDRPGLKSSFDIPQWGGFIEDIDKFDAAFFSISPKEAELMDPQQRLFLQTVCKAIEDAGYGINELNGSLTSLFVGVASQDYAEILAQTIDVEAHSTTGTAHSILPNRVSYLLGLMGTSEAIDTACSSSLIAVHRAVQSLQTGESDLAIAGGVNALLSSTLFESFTKAGMLSKDGRCKTFDESANGYVRGEGVGAILLKPLSKAQADGDHIYGIIKGSAVNHGGHVNTLTAPNPNAQASLIKAACKKANIAPDTLSYIEAHGTGTPLGDPIEINGLKKAFREMAEENHQTLQHHYCGVGSVKSNIGHLETAAGIAGVIKTLLAMQYKTLPKSLHCDNINPYIELEDSPFYIVTEQKKWTPLKDNNHIDIPRRAGVSSFGFGGSNAHVILEEALEQTLTIIHKPYFVITLSGKTAEALKQRQVDLLRWLNNKDHNEIPLNIISYTLNQGRSHFNYRAAWVVESKEALKTELGLTIANKQSDTCFIGIIEKNKKPADNVIYHQVLETLIEKLKSESTLTIKQYKEALETFANLYVNGYSIDWELLHQGEPRQRISLPTYPFAKEQYWVSQARTNNSYQIETQLHPLIHNNISTLSEQRFTTLLRGNVFYLMDHKINGHRLLPGVAYIEMARMAGALSMKLSYIIAIENIVWSQPIVVDKESQEITIALYPKDDVVMFEIRSNINDEELIVHSQGQLLLSANEISEKLQMFELIENISARCEKVILRNEIYQIFSQMHFNYGPSFQVLEWLKVGKDEVLGKLQLNEKISNTNDRDQYYLHPALLDGALQSIMGFTLSTSSQERHLPFALDRIELFKAIPNSCYVHARRQELCGEVQRYDVDVLGETGGLCIRLIGFSTRVLNRVTEEISLSREIILSAQGNISTQDVDVFKTQVSDYLQSIIAIVLNLEKSRLQANEPFETYGIDSILTLQLINVLEKEFGALPKTLFFEYQNLSALTEYFLTHYDSKWKKLFPKESSFMESALFSSVSTSIPHLTSYARARFVTEKETNLTVNSDIAIIGVSGCYPMAKDIDVLWENLKSGKDCVIEVPGERWDYRHYYDPDRNTSTGTYSKWGSFVEDFDKFDPLFFNISPKEAERMDPQERLFLETAWKTIENAGYSAETLSTSLGVFVGVMYSQAQEMVFSDQSSLTMTSSLSSIANRVSYYLNSHGPSMAIDTMCSSSLTSIHLACESIRRQECQMALAGGVNISSHANKYVMLSQGQFLSSDGKCRSFGEGGDGYVPGEGVGAVLLKSLSQAQQDGDHIYAIIKGSSVNHGGKTNGYTVPNPVAQSELIQQTLEKANINPRTISYIEAHGTGTSLGDPIELRGLSKAFEENTEDKQFCSIGSIKSNLGHCESAAGIVGVTKVLLQMQHKQLVPSLYSETINPNLDFEHSPFYLQHELSDWHQPEIEEHGQKKTYPRRAGISSFGAGGSNAHIILEEAPEQTLTTINKPYFVITLSGKTAEALKQRQIDLLNWLNNQNNNIPLNIISYTLNQGRSHFNHRAAWVIESKDTLKEELENSIANKKSTQCFIGIVDKHNQLEDDAIYEEVLTGLIHKLQQQDIQNIKEYRKNLRALANLYVKGYSIDWELLHQGEPKQRISLPTYPFAKERYWIKISGLVSDKISQRTPLWLTKTWLSLPLEKINRSIASIILYDTKSQLLANQLLGHLTNSLLLEVTQIDQWLDKDLSAYPGWIDLSMNEGVSSSSLQWLVLLQRWIESQHSNKKICLQVTQGVECFENKQLTLNGAKKVGLYRMLQSEYSEVRSLHLDLDTNEQDVQVLSSLILQEFTADITAIEVCYRDNIRYVASLMPQKKIPSSSSHKKIQFKSNEILLVTGGTQGIGFACAEHMIRHYGVKHVVLTGREIFPDRTQWEQSDQFSPSIQSKINNIKYLEALGVEIHVLPLILNNPSAVKNTLQDITQKIGPIAGVIHAAGTTSKNNPAFIKKSLHDIAMVLSPKIEGLLNLLEAIDPQFLQFMLLYSSVSSVIPSLATGQSDYAMANAFMDYVASQSNLPIVSIQWPSWKETGMGEVKSAAYVNAGLLTISNSEGLRFLDDALKHLGDRVVMPLMVDTHLFDADRLLTPKLVSRDEKKKTLATSENTLLQSIDEVSVSTWLIALFEAELRMQPGLLKVTVPFVEYGVDSVLLLQILQQINQTLQIELDPSILYEHSNISALTHCLIQDHAKALSTLLNRTVQSISINTAPESLLQYEREPARQYHSINREPIAVIGMSCQFPGAPTLDAYWSLLSQGQSAIAAVPFECWLEATNYYAGLIDNPYAFDSDFFMIKKEDAQAMDPQATLLLQESLKAIYHAGYTHIETNGANTGVYIGARSQASLHVDMLDEARNPIMVIGQNYLAANISQFFNFQGPSLVIDTACSSALMCMDIAVEALQSGKIQSALVGGVSLLTDSSTHVLFERRNLLQKEGVFHILDQRASGVVLGEGVGMVYLKPLSHAERDGDTIYAVIAGISSNNDGRTAGPAAPNIAAQKAVMQQALQQNLIRAQDIQYIDVNGSGSEVTDLLEIKAIDAVYRQDPTHPCYLGSMKPNIGHPLCAEGIASFIKVSLILYHQCLVPFLSGQQAMKHYSMRDKNFVFPRKLQAMELPYAALNSFADGGTNVHVILQHYPINQEVIRRTPCALPAMQLIDSRTLLPLKAKTNLIQLQTELHHAFTKSNVWSQRLTVEHEILKNHEVHDTKILPGLAWIDLLYQWFAEVGMTYHTLELRNISIYRPLLVSADAPVELAIEASLQTGYWTIRVTNQLDLKNRPYITAEMHHIKEIKFSEYLPEDILPSEKNASISLEDLYKICVTQSLKHTGVMKAEGTINLGMEMSIMQLCLNQEAMKNASDYLFHPCLIDSSAIGAMSFSVHNTQSEWPLFLPLFYESFSASSLLTNQCYARIKQASIVKNEEVITLTIEFFNMAREKIGELKNFKTKLVRHAGLINPEFKRMSKDK